MTTQEFFTAFNYKPIDWDHALGFQCMDLYHRYVNDVLPGYPHPAAKGAAWLQGLLPSTHYTWIPNSITAVPQLGDILIWGTGAGGGFGHVAIYSSGNVFNFTSFDQNWPVGSYCHFQGHNYWGDLRGWYRPKQVALSEHEKNQKVRQIYGQPISEEDQNRQAKDVLNS